MEKPDEAAELKQAGIKNTKNKALILRALKSTRHPVSANELHRLCTDTDPVNVATVYRTLQQFGACGIARELPGKDSTLLYEYSGAGSGEHPHFRCERCDTLFCLEGFGTDAARLFAAMARPHRVKQASLTLTGLCERCLRAESQPKKGIE
jgi:Fur family ferric uptake transcriptional regulator